MNRYFHFPTDKSKDKRVIVFQNKCKVGFSYWNGIVDEKPIVGMAWTIGEMKTENAKEITHIKALRIVKNLP